MVGWYAIGCLLEWASLPHWESGSLLVMIRGLLERLQRGDQSVPEVTLVLGSASVALVKGTCTCGLGAGLNIQYL